MPRSDGQERHTRISVAAAAARVIPASPVIANVWAASCGYANEWNVENSSRKPRPPRTPNPRMVADGELPQLSLAREG